LEVKKEAPVAVIGRQLDGSRRKITHRTLFRITDIIIITIASHSENNAVIITFPMSQTETWSSLDKEDAYAAFCCLLI
jgi:hypothetical protein